ncbi:MAG: hypothetical protein ACI92S_002205 [Planctomycetaceae bacterium]|jgi:hypothetical protein
MGKFSRIRQRGIGRCSKEDLRPQSRIHRVESGKELQIRFERELCRQRDQHKAAQPGFNSVNGRKTCREGRLHGRAGLSLVTTEICEPLALASGLDRVGSRMMPAASAVGSQGCE